MTTREREHQERLWINRTKTLLKVMPSSLEIVAYGGSLAICRAGALRECETTDPAPVKSTLRKSLVGLTKRETA